MFAITFMLVFDVCLFVSMFDWVVWWMIKITSVLAFEWGVCDEDCVDVIQLEPESRFSGCLRRCLSWAWV